MWIYRGSLQDQRSWSRHTHHASSDSNCRADFVLVACQLHTTNSACSRRYHFIVLKQAAQVISPGTRTRGTLVRYHGMYPSVRAPARHRLFPSGIFQLHLANKILGLGALPTCPHPTLTVERQSILRADFSNLASPAMLISNMDFVLDTQPVFGSHGSYQVFKGGFQPTFSIYWS